MLHILLDSHPLGLASAPTRNAESVAFTQWTIACLAAGHEIYVPEIIDYELRRELLRAGKTNSIRILNSLKASMNFLAINSSAMLLAATLWSQSRQSGLPTSDPKKLDIDVILAAQALTLGVHLSDLVIATSNVGYISRFVPADLWTNITP